jgi:hypothetical protein
MGRGSQLSQPPHDDSGIVLRLYSSVDLAKARTVIFRYCSFVAYLTFAKSMNDLAIAN